MGKAARLFITSAMALGALAGAPAAAQFSDNYTFLKAVRDADGTKAVSLIDKPGMLDTRDGANGETALHIVVRRHDATWVQYLLSKGANANPRDREGQTPLLIAARLSDPEITRLLLQGGASVDLPDNSGQTPLIIAVQQRDLPTVRVLLAAHANPAQTDHIAGKSAHDYAAADTRSSAILHALDEAKPAAPRKGIAGPVLPR